MIPKRTRLLYERMILLCIVEMFVGCLGKEKSLSYQRAEGDPGSLRQRAVIVDALCFGFLFFIFFNHLWINVSCRLQAEIKNPADAGTLLCLDLI